MRRVFFTVVATVLMAGLIPASAIARHHHHHHARAHRARFERFGDMGTQPASTTSPDNAGTVQSFSGGILTIALNDGSTAKGAVTNDTELECMAPGSTTAHEDGDTGGGDNSSGDNSNGDNNTSSTSEDNTSSSGEDENESSEAQSESQSDPNESSEAQSSSTEDQNDAGEDQGENQSSSCSTSNLTPGTAVREASLRISSTGATWQKVELVS